MIRLINNFADWSRTDACTWTIITVAALYVAFVGYVVAFL